MSFTTKKKIIAASIGLFVFIGVFFAYRAARTVTVLGATSASSQAWEEISASFLEMPKKEEDRLDILIMGFRGYQQGENERGNGELLADTIMLASFNKETGRASLVSLPRDLYVDIPNYGKEKINAAYAVGETQHYGGGGIQLMKALVSMLSGVYVDYGVSINFEGLERLIDIVGGIAIHLDGPFREDKQWTQDGKEDSEYWKIETDEGGIEKWVFEIPSGSHILSGEEALYYVRSRYATSDFDRMRRQQEVMGAFKTKILSLGVLANPLSVFEILDTLGDNLRTDMTMSEIRTGIDLARRGMFSDVPMYVLDASKDNFLFEEYQNYQYVLLPKAGDFKEIQNFFNSILN